MTLSDFLTHSIRFVYILLGVVSVLSYLRQRDGVRLDIALAFGLIGLFNLVEEALFVMHLSAAATPWLVARALQCVTVAHAYLLLRLIQHFHTVPRWLVRGAVGGLLLLLAAALLLPVWPAPLNLLLLAYLAALDIYSAVQLVRGALVTRGVAHRRLQFAALGVACLASVVLVAAVLQLVPALLLVAVYVAEFGAILSGVGLYLGFAPPRALRRAWQLAELDGFLNASAAAPEAPVQVLLQRLVAAAVETVGGRAALVLAPPEWQVAASTDDGLAAGVVAAQRPADYWQAIAVGPGRFVPRLAQWFPAGAAPALLAEAQSALAVPMKTAPRAWGVLLVLLRRGSLFPDDDLHLLELLKQQISLTIDQRALIADLRQQTTELEQANRELEAFTYSVSHDLRTPLRHIEGFAQLLGESHAVSPAGQHYLENINDSTTRMARLIDALLSLSRLGRADLTLTRVPLNDLVEGVRADLAGEAGGRQVVWQVGNLPVVRGDPLLLRQVFTNLLSNALKYTRPRPVAHIEVGARLGENGQAVIFVRDDGVGFDPQYTSRLFTVFQRLHHASEFEGDGIGLANVRRIVHRHGGHAWAEGALEAGATFYVSLPLAEAAAADAPGAAQPANHAAPELAAADVPAAALAGRVTE